MSYLSLPSSCPSVESKIVTEIRRREREHERNADFIFEACENLANNIVPPQNDAESEANKTNSSSATNLNMSEKLQRMHDQFVKNKSIPEAFKVLNELPEGVNSVNINTTNKSKNIPVIYPYNTIRARFNRFKAGDIDLSTNRRCEDSFKVRSPALTIVVCIKKSDLCFEISCPLCTAVFRYQTENGVYQATRIHLSDINEKKPNNPCPAPPQAQEAMLKSGQVIAPSLRNQLLEKHKKWLQMNAEEKIEEKKKIIEILKSVRATMNPYPDFSNRDRRRLVSTHADTRDEFKAAIRETFYTDGDGYRQHKLVSKYLSNDILVSTCGKQWTLDGETTDAIDLVSNDIRNGEVALRGVVFSQSQMDAMKAVGMKEFLNFHAAGVVAVQIALMTKLLREVEGDHINTCWICSNKLDFVTARNVAEKGGFKVRPFSYDRKHCVPGHFDVFNLLPCCVKCNYVRSDKSFDEVVREGKYKSRLVKTIGDLALECNCMVTFAEALRVYMDTRFARRNTPSFFENRQYLLMEEYFSKNI